MIPVSRANNVSIMLTQFPNFRKGPQDIRKALVTGTGLSLERLSLLLQVCHHALAAPLCSSQLPTLCLTHPYLAVCPAGMLLLYLYSAV